MNKTNPAFLVDGFTEKLVIEKLCPNTKINRINCNGHSVSLESIAKRIVSLTRLLNNRYYPIIVIVDREDREISAEEMAANLKDEIERYGLKDDIRIGICDRMIENWILSDKTTFSECCNVEVNDAMVFEGVNGKSFIKKTFPLYQETTDGVSMLLKANPVAMAKNSLSFRNFTQIIQDINCNWLNSLF